MIEIRHITTNQRRRPKAAFALSLLGILLLMASLNACIDDFDDDPFADPVDKFLGSWKCEESSELFGGGFVYDVTITRNPDNSAEILIGNFYMQGDQEKARALVTGNIMIIMRQSICEGTIEISGSGRWENEQIFLTYTANTGADLDQVTARYYRN